ncbi:MAG TPA: hypothetical protein VN622_12870 [Clostridia bacterium]|nr:hypothetical protein [Clostridia bacterium]
MSLLMTMQTMEAKRTSFTIKHPLLSILFIVSISAVFYLVTRLISNLPEKAKEIVSYELVPMVCLCACLALLVRAVLYRFAKGTQHALSSETKQKARAKSAGH